MGEEGEEGGGKGGEFVGVWKRRGVVGLRADGWV